MSLPRPGEKRAECGDVCGKDIYLHDERIDGSGSRTQLDEPTDRPRHVRCMLIMECKLISQDCCR